MATQQPGLACNLQAIPVEMRPQHQQNTERILKAVQQVQELPTGYALRLPNETELLHAIASFIGYERLCCPFFRFTLEVEPGQGSFWLSLSGETDVKPFLREMGFA